jgi:hypothetical protein
MFQPKLAFLPNLAPFFSPHGDLEKLTLWECTRQERRWLCMKSGGMSIPWLSSALAFQLTRKILCVLTQYFRHRVVCISPFQQHRHQSPRTIEESFVSRPALLPPSKFPKPTLSDVVAGAAMLTYCEWVRGERVRYAVARCDLKSKK